MCYLFVYIFGKIRFVRNLTVPVNLYRYKIVLPFEFGVQMFRKLNFFGKKIYNKKEKKLNIEYYFPNTKILRNYLLG